MTTDLWHAVVSMALTLLLAETAACTQGTTVPTEFVGTWEGKARIVVGWTNQRDLEVCVEIRADGSVEGRVGDASLRNATLKRNRGPLGRLIDIKTDYIISGDLDGPILAAEGISRSGVLLPLDWTDGEFSGGLHTTGTHVGGKKDMVLSAAGLELARVVDPSR